MVNITPLLPMILPLATLLWVRTSDHAVSISRNNWYQEYDYIIVGGGSGGAVMASRLSEVSNWNILLLEAGGSESLLSDIPLAAATLQMTPIDWAYQTEPQEASCFGLINRRSRWPRGRVLGGSSVLNYMLYIRGNARDYDKWEGLGALGWSWADVFPYFVKSEDNRDPTVAFNGYHGTGGYLTVSSPPDATRLATTFAQSGKYLGYPNSDLNGPLQASFAIPQGTIRRGARCSTSKAFLRPARGRKNLHVLTFSYATKILFAANKKAVGVQFDRFSMSYTVFARREIILSAGSINTAQLLMLSGVGPADHLKSLGIPMVANLPVGNNLQDHIYPGVHFTVDDPVSLVQRRVVNLPNILKYFASGRGPLTALGGVEGLAFIKTKYVNRSDDYPDFQIHMLSGGPTSDDGQTFRRVQGITRELWTQYYRPFLPFDSFSLYPVLLRPKSRGYVRLRSRNPYDPPVIDPRYLTHPDDIITMVDAMKICIAVGLTPGFRQMNSRLFDAVVPGCEIYKIWSDEYLACMARTYTNTIYHPVGTCRMGMAGDPRAVVDPQLRVLGGIKSLRIADGSIMPNIISGNTNAPIIMIAEKLSDMIKGKRLPRIRPPVAGQTTPVYVNSGHGGYARRSSVANGSYIESDDSLPNTNYDFVNHIMKKLKTNNADDILHSTLEAESVLPPQDLLYASSTKDKMARRSSSHSTRRASTKYLSLKERFAPLINRFGKQKRAMVVMNKIQNLVRNFSNVTTYSFKSIEKKYPEIGQFNNYYEHLLEGQNYDENDMQTILLNLEKLLLKDKVNRQLHNTVFNNESNHTNDELLEAIRSFNILNTS